MNFAYELWFFFFYKQEKYCPHLCHTAKTGEVSKKPKKVIFLFSGAHYSIFFTHCVDQNIKKEVPSRMNFAYELCFFFLSKNKKHIFPTFATLQTQERLVKNSKKFFLLVGHTTQIFLFTYCFDQNKRKKFLQEYYFLKKQEKYFSHLCHTAKHRRG